MKLSGKKYGYNIIAKEAAITVVGFWDAVQGFKKEYDLGEPALLKMFGDEKEYNGLHFWYFWFLIQLITNRSNFEIGDLNWLRSKEYNDYFEYLDSRKGVRNSEWNWQ